MRLKNGGAGTPAAREWGTGCSVEGCRLALETQPALWDLPPVKTLTVDDKKRVRIPDATTGDVYAYENHGDGTLVLTKMTTHVAEPFPKGSLLREITQERNAEQLAILGACVVGPIKPQ